MYSCRKKDRGARGVPYLEEHLLGRCILSEKPRPLQQLLHAAQAPTEAQKELKQSFIQTAVHSFRHTSLNQEEKKKKKTMSGFLAKLVFHISIRVYNLHYTVKEDLLLVF